MVLDWPQPPRDLVLLPIYRTLGAIPAANCAVVSVTCSARSVVRITTEAKLYQQHQVGMDDYRTKLHPV